VGLIEDVEDLIVWNLMENGQYSAKRLMTCNSWAPPSFQCKNLLERLRLPRSTKDLLRPRFKIGFERRNAWRKEDGIIVGLALYVRKLQNQCTTSSLIADTSLIFGKELRIGLASPSSNQHNGKVLQSTIGGVYRWPNPEPQSHVFPRLAHLIGALEWT
jgi:hypothetical protein